LTLSAIKERKEVMTEIDISEVQVALLNKSNPEHGFIIDPKSDTEEVIVPCPPSTMEVKINPRPVIIYLAANAVTPDSADIDAYKAKAVDEQVVIVNPATDDTDELVEVYRYIASRAKALNIVPDGIGIQADAGSMGLAGEFVQALADEGIELGAPVVLTLGA
jgi:hypothetical protein